MQKVDPQLYSAGSEPLVSVIMATYNEPSHYISFAIDSILNQSYRNIELLIFDDSTKIETLSEIDKYTHDTRVKVIRKEKKIGFTRSLNMGLIMAKGYYIARMDADDISFIDRIDKQVHFLEKHTNVDVVGGSINIINEDNTVISFRKYPTKKYLLKFVSIFRSPLAHPTIMMRRTIIDKGYFYDENFKKAEDLEFWLRLIKSGFVISNISDTLLNYRVCGSLSDKRTNLHWKYNLKARLKNFSIRTPIISSASVIVSILYNILPSSAMTFLYNKENT